MSQRLLVILVLAFACCIAAPPRTEGISQAVLDEKLRTTPFHLADSMSDFSNTIFDTLVQAEDGNVFISPFSLFMALGMTYFGSPSDSQTHRELASLLGMSGSLDEEYPTNFYRMMTKYEELRSSGSSAVFNVANKLFIQSGISLNPDYQTLMTTFFKSEVEDVDFGSRGTKDRINRYVADKTNNKIKELLKVIDPLTVTIIINAVYFKDTWQVQFEESDTSPKRFFVSPDNSYVHDKTMHLQADLRVGNIDALDARVLELPYKDQSFRMLIVLPNQEEDLLRVQNRLSSYDFRDVDQRLTMAPTKVQLPRFKVEFSASELVAALQSLGVEALFDENLADLSDMLPGADRIAVSDIIHKAVVEVNEEGSEAAAATAVAFSTRTVGRKPKTVEFVVDRPFFFVIQDKELGVTLFQGRVVDPEGRRSLRTAGQQFNKRHLESQQIFTFLK